MFGNNNGNSGFSAKFLNRIFRKVDGLVWDLQSGALGIKDENGIYTLTQQETAAVAAIPETAQTSGSAAVAASTTFGISVNPFDAFGFSIPAFATQVPLAGIKVGDLIVGDKAILGWVVGKTPAGLKLLDKGGMGKQYSPPKVAIMNTDGALVVQSLGGLFGGAAGVGSLQSSLMPLLMLSGGDASGIESILPLMLFSQMQTANPAAAVEAATAAGVPVAAAANPLASMMPMLMMQAMTKTKGKTRSGGQGGGLGNIDPMVLMMMSGGFGGAAQPGGMNPMMLMMLAQSGTLDGEEDFVSLPTTNGDGSFVPPLAKINRQAPSLRPLSRGVYDN